MMFKYSLMFVYIIIADKICAVECKDKGLW